MLTHILSPLVGMDVVLLDSAREIDSVRKPCYPIMLTVAVAVERRRTFVRTELPPCAVNLELFAARLVFANLDGLVILSKFRGGQNIENYPAPCCIDL